MEVSLDFSPQGYTPDGIAMFGKDEQSMARFFRHPMISKIQSEERGLPVYVDVDMIFQADVAELFSLGTQEHGLAACHDMCLDAIIDASRHKAALGIAPEHGYFNNGMILINGPVWRADGVSEHLTRIALERRPGVTFPSQDPMNIYFSPNRYRLLPPRWNSM